MTPPREGDAATARDRLKKAEEFADSAALHYDEASGAVENPNAYVALAVLSGIASSDVICIARAGRYNASGNHDEAKALLEVADPDAARHLTRLLQLKTKAEYSANTVSNQDVEKARRAHHALLEQAREQSRRA